MTSRPNDDHLHGPGSAHDEWDELAVGYALTALEPDEMERFIEHLVSFCPQCQQAVDDTASVGAELATALTMPVVPPSNALRDSVLSAALAARPAVPQTAADLDRVASVAQLPQRPEPTAVPETPPGRSSGAHRVVDLSERRASRSAGWLVAAAAAVVAVVMSVTALMSIHSRDRTAADAAGYRAAVFAAVGSSGQVVPLRNNGGTEIASVVAHASSVSLVNLDMVPNSKSSSYVLWGINGKTTNPIALGVFDVAGKRVQNQQVGTDSRGYAGFNSFAVSHEPGHTPPAAPTTIVAEGAK